MSGFHQVQSLDRLISVPANGRSFIGQRWAGNLVLNERPLLGRG